jgi:hypothetical protein
MAPEFLLSLLSVGQGVIDSVSRYSNAHIDADLGGIGFHRWAPAPLPGRTSRGIVIIDGFSLARQWLGVTGRLLKMLKSVLHSIVRVQPTFSSDVEYPEESLAWEDNLSSITLRFVEISGEDGMRGVQWGYHHLRGNILTC